MDPWIAVIGAAAALALTGCMDGGDPARDIENATSRIDSSQDFRGERAAVARVVERYEAAVLAGDTGAICRALLDVRENHGNDHDNGGTAYCRRAGSTSPTRLLARAGGEDAFDAIVLRIALDVRRRVPRALAFAAVGGRRETFELTRQVGRWRITAHSFERRPPAAAGEPRCGGRRSAVLSVSYFAGRDARTPRRNLLDSPFGDRIRRTLGEGGSLALAAVSYRPDYRETWVLRDDRGRVIHRYPVTVWGPRSFDTSSAAFCSGERGVLHGVL